MLTSPPMSYVANLRTFVRVYELGSMSAAGRDQRVSAAVASLRSPTSSDTSECGCSTAPPEACSPPSRARSSTRARADPRNHRGGRGRGRRRLAEPARLAARGGAAGIGKRLIAPLVPAFKDLYPEIDVRLRLSDRPSTSPPRASIWFSSSAPSRTEPPGPPDRRLPAPALRRPGLPRQPPDAAHRPGPPRPAPRLPDAPLSRRPRVRLDARRRRRPSPLRGLGTLESDDSDVLTGWALAGRGIMLKPLFEIADHLAPAPSSRSPRRRRRRTSSSPASSRTSGCRTRRAGSSSTSWSPPASGARGRPPAPPRATPRRRANRLRYPNA